MPVSSIVAGPSIRYFRVYIYICLMTFANPVKVCFTFAARGFVLRLHSTFVLRLHRRVFFTFANVCLGFAGFVLRLYVCFTFAENDFFTFAVW